MALVQRLFEDLGYIVIAELLLAIVVLACALFLPQVGGRWFAPLFAGVKAALAPFLWNARRQLLLVGCLAIAPRALLLPVLPPPHPIFHDEHSILLQGQTYAAGRMTNPPHAMWRHFQSFHINQQPTYSSAFFVGRSFPVFVGILLGHPWIGNWISVVAMCVAMCWMLQGWVSLPWALVGGLVTVLRFGIFGYWINSYWGGAITAAGGALVLGALPRILRGARFQDGIWLGVGVLILMTTRPYEGLLVCLPVAAALIVWIARRPGFRAVARIAAPATFLAAIGAIAILYHSWRVTGSPTRSPYTEHREAYALAPAFLFAPPYTNRTYAIPHMRPFYEWELAPYLRRYSPAGLAVILASRIRQIWSFYLGPLLTIPFGAALLMFASDRKVRFLVASLLVFFAGYLVETWGFAHYAAPVTPVFLLLIVIGLQRLRASAWRGSLPGRFLSVAVPVAFFIVMLVPTSTVLLGRPRLNGVQGTHWCCTLAVRAPRVAMIKNLERLPGRDLVVVRYAKDYPGQGQEWVYNDADIDASEVVWAHDLGPDANRPLLDYFKERTIWLLQLSRRQPPQLARYPLP